MEVTSKHLIAILESTFSHTQFYLQRISPELYRKPLDLFSGSSIGQHTRHIVEFMQCLVAQTASGIVSYDKRIRDRVLEEDPIATSKAIDAIFAQIQQLEVPEKLYLESQLNPESEEFTLTKTCFDRELVYNLEHAVHHMAMIKIGIRAIWPDLALPQNFGMANSTVKYRMANS